MLATVVAACGNGDGDTAGTAEPSAGSWKPWVLKSVLDVSVAPPPEEGSAEAKADLDAVKAAASNRNDEVRANVERFNGAMPTEPWTVTAFDFVKRAEKNPPLSGRNYALLHVAMHDATIAAYYWKYQYRIDAPSGVSRLVDLSPDPAYPSEHAAIAAAAAGVLAYMYPAESALRLNEMAAAAAQSRVDAGVNTPSDVAAGLELGRQVAEKVIAYARTDGAGTPWNGQRPAGIGRGPAFWEPAPGSTSPPTDPMAGTWKPWVLEANDQFRPPPPPAFGSPEYVAAARELIEIKNNLTEAQKAQATYWAAGDGTENPAGVTLRTYMEDDFRKATDEGRLTFPRLTRALSLVTVAMADAGVVAWDAKFTYWNARPINGIRDLGLDPTWEPFIPTPKFPAYPSGSAGYGGSAMTVMSYLFPQDAAKFEARGHEQAESRILAGIHWRYDEISFEAGKEVAALVIERARNDRADRAGT